MVLAVLFHVDGWEESSEPIFFVKYPDGSEKI